MRQSSVTGTCRPLRAGAAMLAAALFLGGCATVASERFYRLDAGPGTVVAPAYDGDVRVVVVSLPDMIDRPQLVLRRGPHEIDVRESHRWAEPVRSGVTRALVQDLGSALPQAWITADGPARGDNPVTISVHIDVFEAAIDGEARLEARWLVRGAPVGVVRSERLALRRGAGGTPAAVVAAWSGEIDALAQAIARSLATPPEQR